MSPPFITMPACRTGEHDTFDCCADPVSTARAHIEATALTPSLPPPSGRARVGLELEFHLVDLAAPALRPDWDRVQSALRSLPVLPAGSSVTTEPGGQLELSTPPADGVGAAVAALRADRALLRAALREQGLGAAPLGTDPARQPARVNPSPRYAAMEAHFRAVGCAEAGTAMMTATAALQVNLDAGPREQWTERMSLIRALGPVLVAVSACSPLLGGSSSGWVSMRQQAWHGIDHDRSDPVPGTVPTTAWADYALHAPVMLVPGANGFAPLTERVSFADWLRGHPAPGRRPTMADLDYHLTTLFPPVRPRGYVEIRCLDAAPDRWWPALAALTATLIDDPVAADAARELAEPVAEQWLPAARHGLAHPALARAARGCLDAATRRCGPELRTELEGLAELVHAGRCPGDELRERAAARTPLRVLEEEARA